MLKDLPSIEIKLNNVISIIGKVRNKYPRRRTDTANESKGD
jgi:hypothetical protein